MKPLSSRSSRVIVALAFSSLFPDMDACSQKASLGKGDTCEVSGRTVVFYSMSQPEIDSLSGDQGEINEAMSDFHFYVAQVSRWLKSVRLKSAYTESPVIKFRLSHGRSWVFDRSHEEEQIGMMLTDGENVPFRSVGVDTDTSWIQQIKAYYKLK
jgi:hypothetical protein